MDERFAIVVSVRRLAAGRLGNRAGIEPFRKRLVSGKFEPKKRQKDLVLIYIYTYTYVAL